MTTDYHAKLYAAQLTRRCPSDSVESLTATLMDSQVDLNPHQVDAALFAFRSPLSKGVILADEVGLGKTIEAGIVLSQKWAERKRKILIILPSSLRKQWNQELLEKFNLPSKILESKNFNKALKEGINNPFSTNEIVICSYQFARSKSEYVKNIKWDLVVIDEAHRLRNVYKTGNKVARDLKDALDGVPKLLLTATPLQNSLLELYGLVSFIDEHVFGDKKSFQNQFARTSSGNFDDLKHRLEPVCKRTLRRQVLEYVKFTERKAYTQEFTPSKEEKILYNHVSDYLQRPNLRALPPSQRSLMTLVLRKLLASSTFAIAGALDSLIRKLEKQLKECDDQYEDLLDEIEEDFESFDELEDEFELLEDSDDEISDSIDEIECQVIKDEIEDLRIFYEQAVKITNNSKGKALLQALNTGFTMAEELGGAQKAIIFTESKRTQNYLERLLSENGYANDIVFFNGSNTDSKATQIYNVWKEQNMGTDKITGSRTADTRAALVDYFKNNAKIMIATEAAAEGINLQFCSLVVNYDLPWNPQRIEQRIGRCHRYGQKNDVVVINFINKENAADQRVYQLLSEKFRLFDGVFGASDEVLGAIESGIDFEKKIAEIYQKCRTNEEIQAYFDQLQMDLGTEIDESMKVTRRKLLENFDEEVAEKLKVYNETTSKSLSKYEMLLWQLTKYMLNGVVNFDDSEMTFYLSSDSIGNLDASIPDGLYILKRGNRDGHCYRLTHPLAQWILNEVDKIDLPCAELVFDYTNCGKNVSILKPHIGHSGTLVASKFTLSSLSVEDHIIIAGTTDEGDVLDSEQMNRLFTLPAIVNSCSDVSFSVIDPVYQSMINDIRIESSRRNDHFFEEEIDKLDRWADDKRFSLKMLLKSIEDEKRELTIASRSAANLQEKITIQKQIKSLDSKYDEEWRIYEDDAKKIRIQKEEFLNEIEKKLNQAEEEEILFTIRWKIV